MTETTPLAPSAAEAAAATERLAAWVIGALTAIVIGGVPSSSTGRTVVPSVARVASDSAHLSPPLAAAFIRADETAQTERNGEWLTVCLAFASARRIVSTR